VKLYRVIVGPLRDVADLSSTREELRKTGFGKVIVQKY
jgi:cell division protein FtsN